MKKTTERTSYVRYSILAAVFVNVVINYMDRVNISVAAPLIADDFKLDPVQMGFIFSAFGWTYSALQIPGGILADRFGPRIVYTFSLICWSLMTLMQAFARGFASLVGLRMATGLFEAPAFPTNNRIVTSWFPDNQRAGAIATYTTGQFIGVALLAPALTSLQYYTGWKTLFIITGTVGIAWGIVWYFFYRDPQDHPRVSEQELQLIEKGGGLTRRKDTATAGKKFSWKDLKSVFTQRKLWGIYLGQFTMGGTFWFFLTWFPTYLVKYRHIDYLKSGWLASAPFAAACIGLLLSGYVSDYLVRKGISLSIARKAPVITGMLLSVAIIGANYVDSPALIITFMCVSFFGNGLASITWIFVSALSPKNLIGLTGGAFNFIGGLAGIVMPAAIGFLVKEGDFEPALFFVGAVGLAGVFSYVFLVGKVERIQLSEN